MIQLDANSIESSVPPFLLSISFFPYALHVTTMPVYPVFEQTLNYAELQVLLVCLFK